jgi:hypothetical protein
VVTSGNLALVKAKRAGGNLWVYIAQPMFLRASPVGHNDYPDRPIRRWELPLETPTTTTHTTTTTTQHTHTGMCFQEEQIEAESLWLEVEQRELQKYWSAFQTPQPPVEIDPVTAETIKDFQENGEYGAWLEDEYEKIDLKGNFFLFYSLRTHKHTTTTHTNRWFCDYSSRQSKYLERCRPSHFQQSLLLEVWTVSNVPVKSVVTVVKSNPLLSSLLPVTTKIAVTTTSIVTIALKRKWKTGV